MRGGDFELYFDLKTQVFCHRDRPEPPPPHWLPMWEVVDSRRLNSWLVGRDPSCNSPESQAALNLGRMVREHELNLYVLDTPDEQAVRVLFARLNNTGRRLKETEVFQGLHKGTNEGIEDLDGLALRVAESGFGSLSPERLLQVSLAVGGAEFRRRLQGRMHSRELPAQRRAQVPAALLAALTFLRDYAGIPSAAEVPGALVLCLLSILSARFGGLEGRDAELLGRFVWRGSAGGRLNGRDQELSARLYRVARTEPSLSAAVQAMLSEVPREAPPGPLIPAFTPTSGLAGLSLLAMVDHEPRHLLERRRCPLEELRGPRGRLSVHRLFSREELKGVEGVTGLANIVLHPEVEGVTSYARLFRGLPEMFSAEILASHGFTHASWAALRRGEMEACLRARAEVLDRWVEERFQRHARWDAPDRDRPPIASLVEPADE